MLELIKNMLNISRHNNSYNKHRGQAKVIVIRTKVDLHELVIYYQMPQYSTN